MLKKLFKYEWKAFWKVPTAINVFLGIITFIGIISLASPFWELDMRGIEIMLGLAVFFYILAIAAGSIGVVIAITARYYRNIYTDEGYLTNTLPVTARQIILSKLFTGVIWSLITGAVVSISIFSLIYTAALSYSDTDIFYEFLHGFPEFLRAFKEELDISFFLFAFLGLIYMILSTTLSILKIYTAIALGQLFTRHKVAGAVMWYIGEYVFFEIITSFLRGIPSYSYSGGLFSLFFSYGINYYNRYGSYGYSILLSMLIAIGTCLAVCAGLYFLTEHMLKNRLNLD